MDPELSPSPRDCAKHGVALDPMGRCVLCRREEAGSEDPSARIAVTALVILGLVVAAAFVYKGSARRAEPPVVVDNGPPLPVLAEAPPPPEDLEARKERARAVQDNRAARERAEAVEKEMKRVPIRVYTTKWCKLCGAARDFFTQKGYPFEEIDVEASPEDLAALRKLNREATVPTIVVGEEVIVGYGPTVVLSAIYRAAEKKVR